MAKTAAGGRKKPCGTGLRRNRPCPHRPDRLEIYFDPAYSIEQAGVILGTTSPSEGRRGPLPRAGPVLGRTGF